MSLSSTATKNIATANGTQTVWPYTFPSILADGSDVKIVITDLDGSETEITTNFTINTATSEITYPSVVSGLPAVTSGYLVTLYREEELTQELDLTRQGAFNSDNIEASLDKLTAIAQQHEEKFTRTIQYPISTDPDDLDPTPFLTQITEIKDAAEAAQTAAETAETNAETAEANAESAEAAAEAAQAAAEAAAAAFTLASQAEAEAGTDNVKYLSSLRTKQAIDALSPVRASNTVTLTNKRVTPRTDTVASSATPTINTDTTDFFTITALAAAITSFTTNLSGTPTSGQKLIIRIKDDGTARAITWGASFASRGATLPTTTVLGKYHYVGLIWNSTASTWDCIAAIVEA